VNRDILVTILEDDLFSRNWMTLMLVRDWRTRVVGEFSSPVEFCVFLQKAEQPFDVVILDVESFGEDFSINEICQNVQKVNLSKKILLIGTRPDPKVIRLIQNDPISGYVLKQEVGYSLSWVISFLFSGAFVLTPSTLTLAHRMNIVLPEHKLVINGQKSIPGFTDHETEVARLAFIFSLGRRDLADELKISEQWSYGLVSELYKKMGLSEILSGEVDLFSYIPDSPIIRNHFTEIIEQLGSSTKARDMETLSYHLLTMPEIVT
jgi:DNA-binding NarL/FixJ family response regulator